MRLDKRRLILILLVVFIVAVSVVTAQKKQTRDDYVVQNFKVEDVPSDDGTGLMLSWKPLDRDKRIIEYRVYRGVSPDSLFFLESIPVNVKTGVASDKMYYYDNSGSELLDVNSPRKLRKEKQQDLKSPLYRKAPVDIKLLAELGKKFTLISVIDKNHLYYNSVESHSADPADSMYYAGMKLNKQTIIAMLNPGEKYYYTVLAVNERNQFQSYAKIESGTPVPNPPDPAPALNCVYLSDKATLSFDWDYPLYKDDLVRYQIHQVNGVTPEEWAKLKLVQDPKLKFSNPVTPPGPVGGGNLKNYTTVQLGDPAQAAALLAQVQGSKYAIELMDGDGFSSFSDLVSPRIMTSAALPPMPAYYVEDKPNDKGDRLSVIWDNPIVFVVKTSSMNSKNTKLRINYQLNKAETQKVKNIYFEFFKPGESKPFTKINEYYQDNTIVLKVPAGYDYAKGFKVRMTLKGKPEIKDYALEQELVWDKKMMTLMPEKQLYRNGVEVSSMQNVVYRRSMSSDTMILVKKNTSYDNNLDVTIAYPTVMQKQIYGFNYIDKGKLVTISYAGPKPRSFQRPLKKGEKVANVSLIDSKIDLTFDKKTEQTVNTNIYLAAALKDVTDKINQTKKQADELKAQIAQMRSMNPAPPELEQMSKQLEKLDKTLAVLNSNAELKKANSIKGRRSRMHYIASLREDYSRYQTYQVVRTDGKGLFVETTPELDKDGKPVFHKPVSNWFDTNKYVTLFATLLFGLFVVIFVNLAKRGRDLYIRPIAGLAEIDNAIGRATEMGRPMLYCMGAGGLSDVATLASLGILGLVAKKAAEYDTKLIVPCYDYIVMPIAQEIVREAHYSVGRPDTYDKNSVFYLTNVQFAYVAGVNGIMVRERMATNFFLGYFAAEALLMTETGNAVGAVQIAGTDATTQIPFFITTCDYTLIGEELYAASAYLNREPMLLGTLKAQDYFKFVILSIVFVGAILATFQITGLTLLLPLK